MRRIAISRLLMVAVLVPLLGLAIFGAKLTWDSYVRYGDLTRASSVLRVAVAAARFAGVAVSGEGTGNRDVIVGRADRSILASRRKITDDIVSELQRSRTLGQASFDRALAALGPDLVIELVSVIGFYTTAAMMINAFDAPVPGGARPLP